LVLCTLLAQEKAVTAGSVPFIGCKSDGQVGPVEAPEGTSPSIPISLKATYALAYYRSAQGLGVLAPRGWYCFGTYGSSGYTLLISPLPIDTANIFSAGREGFSGPAIEISNTFGDTSGRFYVVEIIARIFPAYKAFVTALTELFDQPASSYTFGPYPGDKLTYKSDAVVEYRTPPQTDGLGTHSWLKKNSDPINGVAILAGNTPDLLLLSVRLPRDLTALTAAIVVQVERDAGKF
jgi:hypothetical protein